MLTVQELAADDPEFFSGDLKESDESLRDVEGVLEVKLPNDLKWLMKTCGYGDCCPIPNIQECIPNTKRFREAVSLPRQYVVLDDRNDAGAVLLDTESRAGTVLWVDTHALYKLNGGHPEPSEINEYTDFVSWVSYCLEEAKSESAT